MIGMSRANWGLSAFTVLSLYCATSEAAKAGVKNLATYVLKIDSLSEYAAEMFFVFLAYTSTYLIVAGLFEYTNPVKSAKRTESMKKEIMMGVAAMVFNVGFAVGWIWLVEPHTRWYGYFAKHEYTFVDFLINLGAYLFFMDGFFYWSHRLLHVTKPFNLWATIHRYHHQFKEPTAFAQDAVHPLEAVLQGPLPHYLVTLFLPFHPVPLAAFGFLTSIYAIAAHDGRQYDFNRHMAHHHYKNVNFGLYWGFWDFVCDTRYSPEKYPERYWDDKNEELAYKGSMTTIVNGHAKPVKAD